MNLSDGAVPTPPPAATPRCLDREAVDRRACPYCGDTVPDLELHLARSFQVDRVQSSEILYRYDRDMTWHHYQSRKLVKGQ